jgi:methylmalonyl-CoA/ethylmalonyl-CoA epimerase
MRITRLHQVAAKSAGGTTMIEFYRDTLGAKFIGQFDPPGIVFFDLSGIRLMFEAGASVATLYFWVDDVDTAKAELEGKGVHFESDAHMVHRDEDGTFDNPGTEEWMAFFKDPAGNTLALVTRK